MRSGYVAAVVADARRQQRALDPAQGQPGDLFALWFPTLARHAHLGVLVSRSPGGRWTTHEGNTDDDGGREGWGFFERTGLRARLLGPQDVVLTWR